MQFSFVIPTLNEEKNIRKVIRQFCVLKGKYSYEVILGDGGSSDKTVSIARKLGARVIIDRSRRKTIAGGRNIGAKAARGDILVFCDADTLLEDVSQFAARVTALFSDARIVAAMPSIRISPGERIWKDAVFYSFFNAFLRLSFFFKYPFSSGQCQIVRPEAFKRAGMYDVRLRHAEDSALFQKIRRLGTLRFIADLTVYDSPRRWRRFGYMNTIAKGVYAVLGQKILRRDVIKGWKKMT